MFEFLTTVILALSAIASPPLPYTYHPNIAHAQTASLASSLLAVSDIPHPPEKPPQDEKTGEEIAQDDFDPQTSPEATTTLKTLGVEAIKDLIKYYSALYAVSYEEMSRVMACESSGKIDAVGDNGRAYGLFQFWENTFKLFAKDMGEKLEWKNPEHQIKLASWAFSKGKQTHWTCWKNI